MYINKKAFTLVELIVVITILAILTTVSFLSFWSFMVWARDSSRVSDIKNMKVVLEAFSVDRWVFPIPSNPINFTYSWATVFTQWTFWKSVRVNLWGQMSKTPVDPLYKNEYTYSVASNKRSYDLWYIKEWTLGLNNNWIGNKTYAEDIPLREYIGRVDWNYNGQIMHTYTGWLVYVFSLPSLITTQTTSTWVLNLTDKIVYEWKSNLPASYSWKVIQVWSLKYKPQLVFTWSALPKNPAQLKKLIENLKVSIQNPDYPTSLFSNPDFKDLIELDTSNPNELYNYGKKYINSWLWGRFQLKYPKNCKEILWTDDDIWDWMYTISANWYDKIDVYCDMTTDWWGWTRVRSRERWVWYTEWADINKTRWLEWSELMTNYTRYWKIRVSDWAWWYQDLDVSGKKYWLLYKTFKTKQTQESGFCWEHTTISDLISQVTSWSWWDCSRSCQRIDPNDPTSSCDSTLEYTDILVDDLWEDIWLSNDKDLTSEWFSDDPCVINGHKDTDRNVSWNSHWSVSHRIDSSTSLTNLWGWDQYRCNWVAYSESWIQDRLDWESDTNWHWHKEFPSNLNLSDYNAWYQTNDLYIR